MSRPSTAKIIQSCKVVGRDAQGRVNKVNVPGHDNRWYQVIIRRAPAGYSVECRQDVGKLGFLPCEAFQNWKVCYHARCALVVAAMHPPEGTVAHHLGFYKIRPHHGRVANIGKGMIVVRLFRDNKPREFIQVRELN